MEVEIEAKFLNINTRDLRNILKKSGAVLIHSERLMRRKNFDFPDRRLEKIGGWIRVRDEGDKVTLAYKQLFDRTLEGTKEISLIIEDFDKISNFLKAIGLENKSYQETKRERWDFEGVEVTIDTWPWIPTFVELEAKNEMSLKEIAKKLNLEWTDAIHGSVETAYQAYYNVSEEEIDAWNEITFIPVPDWLEVRKK
ncbi:CYTH domain-containing protein [Candidatus Giovannonibacteria bacterium]|nr:CYTH domain-containing protein [Candidatus Giovannonibacteria bacterium]